MQRPFLFGRASPVIRIATSVAITLSLSACGSFGQLDPFGKPQQTEADGVDLAIERYAEFVVSSQDGACPQAGLSPTGAKEAGGAIIAAVAPVISNFVYGQIAAFAQRIKDDLNATSVVIGTARIPTSANPSTCVIVVRGVVGVGSGAPGGATVLSPQVFTATGLSRYPDLYAEYWLTRVSKDQVLVEPAYLYYRNTAAKHRGSGGTKNLTIGLGLTSDPIKDKDAAAALTQVAAFSYPKTKIGTAFTSELLTKEKRLLKISDDHSSLNVSALVNESDKADLATEFLITLLSDSNVKKAVTDKSTTAILQLFGADTKK